MLYHESLKETIRRHFMEFYEGTIFRIISRHCEREAQKGRLSTKLEMEVTLDEKCIESILFFLKEEDDIDAIVEKINDIYIFDCSWKNANKKRIVVEK